MRLCAVVSNLNLASPAAGAQECKHGRHPPKRRSQAQPSPARAEQHVNGSWTLRTVCVGPPAAAAAAAV